MRIISFEAIKNLNIPITDCLSWVNDALKLKYKVELPKKTSIKLNNGTMFFNSMPCYIPEINRFAIKQVSRYPDRHPAISGELLLYDSTTGDLLAIMDADWITAIRTGAVATSAINLFKSQSSKTYAFMGLGITARATILCLLESNPNENFLVKLLKYKDQADSFIERFKDYENVKFEIVNSEEELITNTDVIVSCVTVAEKIIGNDAWFKEGVLVVPVHTRGFQNCDLFFDKVFADDEDHVKEFKHFNKFKSFNETSRVLLEQSEGRTSDKERILSYNIGLALHDTYFASKIYDLISNDTSLPTISLEKSKDKFWL